MRESIISITRKTICIFVVTKYDEDRTKKINQDIFEVKKMTCSHIIPCKASNVQRFGA